MLKNKNFQINMVKQDLTISADLLLNSFPLNRALHPDNALSGQKPESIY